MKADFEKGTKVCSKCKRELPIEMFGKDLSRIDRLNCNCKKCSIIRYKEYKNKNKDKIKDYYDRVENTFGRIRWDTKGISNILKRDYELTSEELERRNKKRIRNKAKSKQINAKGILISYDGKLNESDLKLYKLIMIREYNRQRGCAIRGYIGRTNPSEHFLFDFDLEQMLKDNVYLSSSRGKQYITKWWKGEIRHWTVNDGIWKE